MQTRIILEEADGISRLRLEGPEGKPPTLDREVLSELAQALDRLEAETPIALVVESNSPRYFCVGADLNVLKTTTEETIGPWVEQGHEVLNHLEDLPCPVIAVVSGYAMGGGLELAIACDLILAHDNAKCAQSEAALGFIPGWGGTLRLPERIGIPRAKQMFYTGRMLDAATAVSWGLADASGTPEEMASLLLEWLEAIR